ncbi:MAG: aminopeptidase, partial [Clostridiales bacterium]|nr:aminopeptidase [Clostridiales bacterium]
MERKSAWEKYSDEDIRSVFDFAEEYREFLSDCKTERECVTEFTARAKAAGFLDLKEVRQAGITLKPGDRVFADNQGKNIAMFVIGCRPFEDGMNILGAHIDSPRLDLKQNPLYEDTEMVLLDTHY